MSGNAVEVVAEVRDGVMVVVEHIGEGICGEYDPADGKDTPLLRFTVYSGEPGGVRLKARATARTYRQTPPLARLGDWLR